MHPDASKKIGVGVQSFRIAPDGWSGMCFWIDRIDGTSTDLSYNECLSPSPWRWFTAAARSAIEPQIKMVRQQIVYG